MVSSFDAMRCRSTMEACLDLRCGISHTKEASPCNCSRSRLCSFPRSLVQAGRYMARSTVTKADSSLAGDRDPRAACRRRRLRALQRRCAFRRYEPGESIVDYLDQTDEVFFIISGEVRVTIYSLAGKVVSFRELGPGEVFGEYPAIDRGPRSASVEARNAVPCRYAARRRVQGTDRERAGGGAGDAAAARDEDQGAHDARL